MLFDIFTKTQPKTKNKPSAAARTGINFNPQSNGDALGNGIKVFHPKSFEDVSNVIDVLSMGKPAIVNLREVRDGTAQRVLDLLCGAIYALKGGLYELEKNIYVFTPDGVSVN